jgi:hypothetical protein
VESTSHPNKLQRAKMPVLAKPVLTEDWADRATTATAELNSV